MEHDIRHILDAMERILFWIRLATIARLATLALICVGAIALVYIAITHPANGACTTATRLGTPSAECDR